MHTWLTKRLFLVVVVSLAVDKSLTFHTGRRTGEVRLIKHHQETAKVRHDFEAMTGQANI